MKAVIVDLQGRYAAALVETGEVRKIANNNYEIGQSIELQEVSQGRKRAPLSKTIKRVGSIAAAVAILGGEVEKTVDYRIPETDVVHRIIVIRKVKKTPRGYPRRFAKISKEPII